MAVKKFILLGIFLLGLLMFYPEASQLTNSFVPKMNSHLIHKEISINLPSSMKVLENPMEDQEQLIFSASLNDEHYALRGYIQIWQINDLADYLQKSKEISPFDFYTYSLNPTQVNNLQGYVNSWGASFGQLTKISGLEYWLNTPYNKVLRLAFLTSSPSFNDDQQKIIQYILSTVSCPEAALKIDYTIKG